MSQKINHKDADTPEELTRWIWDKYVGVPVAGDAWVQEYENLLDRVRRMDRSSFTKGLHEGKNQIKALASHAPSDLKDAIAALDACVGCLMIQGFPADHPDVKHAYGIVLKYQAMKPSEAAVQPTKRQQIDALVKAEYEDGLYDRLPEIEHNDHQPTPVHHPEEK